MRKESFSRKVFVLFNYFLIGALSFLCFAPIINLFAISLSTNWAVTAGIVKLWPVGFTLNAYKYVMDNPDFMGSFLISFERVFLGVAVNTLLTLLSAYPLSKDTRIFKHRKIYIWYFVITMLFSGGLIPWYMVINKMGLIDNIWALVLPGAVPVFNVILLMNFFKGIPRAIEESAFVDGASYLRSLISIYIPLSLPALATITLFSMVGHWNSWFDGLLLMNSPSNYPLQSYLRTFIIQIDASVKNASNLRLLSNINERTGKAAQMFIAIVPIIIVYPFLQKYFTKGIVMGSVKE